MVVRAHCSLEGIPWRTSHCRHNRMHHWEHRQHLIDASTSATEAVPAFWHKMRNHPGWYCTGWCAGPEVNASAHVATDNSMDATLQQAGENL